MTHAPLCLSCARRAKRFTGKPVCSGLRLNITAYSVFHFFVFTHALGRVAVNQVDTMELSSLSKLQTERVNPRTTHIDRLSTLEMCTIINADDHKVAESVKPCLPVVARAIDALAARVRRGGRVVYVGAGTSGRSVINLNYPKNLSR